MSPTMLRRGMKAFGNCPFIQHYGQTECSSSHCFLMPEEHELSENAWEEGRLSSCGREGVLNSIRVVNEKREDVRRDRKEVGEIIVKGDCVMKGYWGQPELTAQTLIDGWCYSGDLATMDKDGYIYIMDRKKDMIKSGGENVFSKIVEDAIFKHPAVKEVAVIGVPSAKWGEAVTAIVVLKEGMSASQEEIIDEAKKHIAGYMKPQSVEFVKELPKTPLGKVLKRELKKKYWAGKDRYVTVFD